MNNSKYQLSVKTNRLHHSNEKRTSNHGRYKDKPNRKRTTPPSKIWWFSNPNICRNIRRRIQELTQRDRTFEKQHHTTIQHEYTTDHNTKTDKNMTKQQRELKTKTKIEELKNELNANQLHLMKLKQEKNASSWLTSLPHSKKKVIS